MHLMEWEPEAQRVRQQVNPHLGKPTACANSSISRQQAKAPFRDLKTLLLLIRRFQTSETTPFPPVIFFFLITSPQRVLEANEKQQERGVSTPFTMRHFFWGNTPKNRLQWERQAASKCLQLGYLRQPHTEKNSSAPAWASGADYDTQKDEIRLNCMGPLACGCFSVLNTTVLHDP